MSSYLLAMAVVNYKYKEKTMKSISGNTIRVRVWLIPELIENAAEPLENGVKLISYYEKKLGQPYPLPKMDMIGVKLLAAAAMENWGLIIYDGSSLGSSYAWFGNLVTMKFWDDIFLNEGFAAFLQVLALVGIGEKHDMMTYYRALNVVLLKEGVSFPPRAVHYEPVWPEDYINIKKIFNKYVYFKGASAIRTIELAMESKEFYEGIKLYLNRYQFGNADYHDLLNTLSEAKPLNQTSGGPKSIAEFAETWILQPGYPAVTVKRHNATHVELTQKPRSFEGSAPVSKAKWWIPIFYKVDGKARPMEWLFETLHLEVGQDEALILNEDLNVLYCVNNDNETLNAVKKRIGDKNIFPWPALQKLIENSIVSANVNCTSHDSALELLAEVFKHRFDDLKGHFAETGQKLDRKLRFTESKANLDYYENVKEIDALGSVMDFMQANRPNYVNERTRY
ncbi:peptidase family m1 domain-containing protein [Ditylenchus destructor]|uniref:Peptidase family m1 domain-containing protein n=1 Tax=Ditylenchus destructor TaxID=166010 RepID=A0AAD4MJ83_9BILA|nr:peptidase family m1 domain-containing protein [Ditylenchus destructor]